MLSSFWGLLYFLTAAKDRNVPPKFPQPTHDFPGNRSLLINFTNRDSLYPIEAEKGTGVHPFITVYPRSVAPPPNLANQPHIPGLAQKVNM
jgi:hypothetical protein